MLVVEGICPLCKSPAFYEADDLEGYGEDKGYCGSKDLKLSELDRTDKVLMYHIHKAFYEECETCCADSEIEAWYNMDTNQFDVKEKLCNVDGTFPKTIDKLIELYWDTEMDQDHYDELCATLISDAHPVLNMMKRLVRLSSQGLNPNIVGDR